MRGNLSYAPAGGCDNGLHISPRLAPGATVFRPLRGHRAAPIMTAEISDALYYPRIHSGSPEAMEARMASINSSRVA